MNVIIQGRQHRFVGGSLGDKPITEIWLGDKQIWPNTEGLARRIVVELPKTGTLDWQYWVHALQATENKAASNNYMRFVHDGLSFYINHSPDGTEAYRLDGNVLTVELDGILIDQLGGYLEVESNIASRESDKYEGTALCFLPYLEDSMLKVVFHKGKKRKWAGRAFTVSSSESGVVHYGGSCETSQHKRGKKTRILPENTHKWYNRVYNNTMQVGETMLQIETQAIGSGGGGGVTLMWPAFKRKFKLKIISVS